MKAVIGVEPAVEAENVCVQIRLQMVLDNGPVMGAQNPGFEVGEDQMNHGQVSLGLVRIARQNQRIMDISQRQQCLITRPAISANRGTFSHAILDKAR